MNKVYRIVWSHAHSAWVVASELASGVSKASSGSRKRKSLVASAVLMAAMPLSQSIAANYVVSTEAELRQAIIDANADGDASSTITLGADISISNTAAAFTQATKPLTIDTAGHALTAQMVTGSTAGVDLSFLGGSLVTTGTFTGGDARNATSNRAGGAGLKLVDGALENDATVTGGRGGFNISTGSGQSGAGGVGAHLTGSDLLNRGTISGGDGGEYDAANGTSTGATRTAGAGGNGVSMTNGSLDNRGTISGGDGGTYIRLPASADNSYGGAGGVGAALSGGTHSNSGTIIGGTGGRGANVGGGAGAYPGGVGVTLRDSASLVNAAGGTITGGSGTTSVGSAPASVGGVGASVGNSTLENHGTISGGLSGSTAVNGGVGINSDGNANVINDGIILGGTRSNGATYHSAVAFGGTNNRLELRSNSSITGNVIGGATDILALGGSNDASFNVASIGAAAQYRNFGNYQKSGSSTWTLTGTTAFATPWFLLDGVLSVSEDGNLGANTARLTFDGGTLEVTGTTYSSTSRPITAAVGGGVIDIDDAANQFTISSVINGDGGLTKVGSGALIFTGDNVYTGGTTITEGLLQLGAGGTSGNIASGALINNGALAINRSDDMTIVGAISGIGYVSQLGAGVTTLSGVNSYIGGTTISDGSLRGSATSFGSGAILNNGSLVLEQVGSGTLSNLISGSGSVIKQGSGTLSLTAANSYTGATNVNAGTLYINGNHSAATGLTTVQTGGTLGGTGTIGGAVAVNDGTLAPGANGVGTLAILGNLTLDANSVLSFELGAPDVVGGAFNDLLHVQGSLTLDGTLDVAVSPGGSYGPGFYRLISYSGGLTDNTLDLGTMPAGAMQSLQVSIPGQVNLINTQGMVLRWWDGDTSDPSDRHDGEIAGGSGTWFADAVGTNINWTDETGTPNGAFLDSAFAMFTTAPGTVTVDDSIGAVRVAGMQFSVDGYRIEGDAVTLSTGTNTIRVGDGTAASATMSATIASDLTGAGRLDKADAGTLILTANNTYTGGTTISGGTLQLGDGGTTGSIAGTVSNNGALAFNRSNAVAFGGVISGTGAVSQLGAGTTTLSGVNTYGGGTTISAGTLAGSATSFGSGNILNDAALIITQPSNAEFANVISGTGSLDKQGAGTLALTGNSAFTGLTTISAGTLQFGAGGTSGSIAGDIVNNGLLAFNRADSMTYAGDVTGFGDMSQLGTGVTTLTGSSEVNVLRVSAGELRLADGAQMSIQGAVNENLFISGTGTAPVMTITGLQTSLTMASQSVWVGDTGANTSGTFNIEAGAQVSLSGLVSGRAVSSTSFGVTNISGPGTHLQASSIALAGVAYSGSRSEINVSGGATVSADSHDSGNLASSGALASTVVSGAGTSWANTGANGLRLYAGSLDVVDGASYETTTARIGGYNVTAAAHTGSLRVSGSGSTFTSTGNINVGTTNTTSGEITLSDEGLVSTAGAVVLGQVAGATGTLNIGAAAVDDARAAGELDAASITFGAGAGTLSFNHTDTDYVLDATITGTGTINHLDGTTALTGDGSAFVGATTVSGGTLHIGRAGTGSLGTAASTITVANGATLGGSGVIGGAVTIADGGTLAPGNSPGTLTMGSLTLNALSILDFELGATNVVGGALNDLINVNGALTLDGMLNVTQATGGTFDVGIYRLINYTGALTNNTLELGTMPAGSTAVLQTSVANQVNLINTEGLTFRFWDGPAGHDNSLFDGNGGVWLASGDRNWTVVDPFVNGAWDDAAFAVFQGTAGTVVVDDSAGEVRFSGAQFLVDGYTIDGPDTLNTNRAETFIRVGDGTMAGAAMTATINAAINGSGGLVKADAGTLVLGADNGYTGGTRIATGVLQLGEGGTTGSILDSDIVNDGTLAFNRSNAMTFGGVISGTGSVTQIGAGTTTLGDVNTYQGGTEVTGGTLAGTATSFGEGEISTALAGTLRIDQATSATMANEFAGAGTIVKQGAGALNLTGDSSAFAGTTNVTAGTLSVNGTLGDAASTVDVSNGATLAGAGTIGGSVTVNDGRLAAGNSPGTLNIAGNLTLTADSMLDFELGEVNVVGGALNDLIVVGGNLTLDGTLNVSPSAGGAYGAGIYRLINYTGALTNNVLELGSMPVDSINYLQTSLANQINLINTDGLLLRYWDGPSLPRNNDRIEGGNGVWLAAPGNENWTTPDGAINAAYQDGTFAVFAGTAGTVVADTSLGALNVSGMQFAVDGYRIEGDAVTLVSGSNAIRVGDGSALGAGFTATIDSELTGAGALNKDDLGRLVLTGANSYTGGTTISNGALQLGDGATSGSIVGDIANSGTLAFNRSDTATFAGAISGAGELHQIGSGTTTLTGTNGYTGATRIDAGTLALSGAGSLAASSNVVADGLFDISATNAGASIVTLSGSGSAVLGAQALTLTAATGAFDGIVTGAGTLNTNSASAWTLTGAGSAVGTLNVRSGELAVASGATVAAQTTHVAAGATLRNAGAFAGTVGADSFTLDGRLIGHVALLAGDDRVLIADGADFSQASFDGDVGVDTLELTHHSALTYNNALTSNFEHLVKRGGGVLTFESTVDTFTDSVTLAVGSAHLSGATLETDHLHVQSGATLTGVGSISGDLTNAGVLSPGMSPGVILLGGDFVQSASGTLVSEIQRTGNDLLDITGTVSLAGTHDVQVSYGLYLDGTTQTLLRSAGSVSDTFDNVTINPSALMTAIHRVNPNTVTVSFERQATTTVTQPGTGKDEFAKWLDEQIGTGGLTPEMIDYIDTLLQQPTAPRAADLLGEISEPVASVSQDGASILGVGFAGAVFDRFAINDRAQCTSVGGEVGDARNCAWVQGLRQWGDADGDRFAPRYDWTTNGVQIGIDHTSKSAWTLGLSAGHANVDTHDIRGARNDLSSTMGGLYTNYTGERLGFGAVAMYASHESRTTRASRIGAATHQAHAKFDYNSAAFGMRLDYRLTSADRALVRPFAEVFYDRIDGASFAEREGGAGNLSASIHDREGLRGTLGFQFAENYEGYGLVFRPSLEVGVVHQFLDTQSTLDLQPFGSTSSFRSHSVQLDRTSYRANASLGISLGANAGMALSYGGDVASDRSQHEVTLGFRVVW